MRVVKKQVVKPSTIRNGKRTKTKRPRSRFRIPPPIFQGFKRRFYCLYCKNSYKSTPKNVNNHISGHSHKNSVKTYYLNKFLQLYDRSYLKSRGEFKLGNDLNRFENTLLNNRKLGIQFKNIQGSDKETGSEMLSKLAIVNTKGDMNVPNFILKRRAILKQKKKQKIKNAINMKNMNKNKKKAITNKDKQQLHEAKQILRQLNHKKQNSYKKYQLSKKRKKLLKVLGANTDSNLNLNYNFGGDRKTKYHQSGKDNSLQILNHIYKKSPNYNRVFLNNNQDFDIWDARESHFTKFNEDFKNKKLKSLKTKIAKVKKRIQIKRKYGKRKFNPRFKATKQKTQNEDKKWLDKFNRKFTDETYLNYLKLKLKRFNNISHKRKVKVDKRASQYKLFNEDIHIRKFIQKVQQEKNKYTNSLLLPPRTLNINSNKVAFNDESNSEFISFPLISKQKQQQMGPIPAWLSKHSNNKLLSRRLLFPKTKDLEALSTIEYNSLNKSKKLKHFIKQALYKQQKIKSMFKYQGYLWKNYRKRNSIYKMNNNILQNPRIIELLQLKSMKQHWFNKIYGKREGKVKKLQRLSRYKEIRDKKLKYRKKEPSKNVKGSSKITNNKIKKIVPSKSKTKNEQIRVSRFENKTLTSKTGPVKDKAGKQVSNYRSAKGKEAETRSQKLFQLLEIKQSFEAKPKVTSRFNTPSSSQSQVKSNPNSTTPRFERNTNYPLQTEKLSRYNQTSSRFTNSRITTPGYRFNNTGSINRTNTTIGSRFNNENNSTTETVPITGNRFNNDPNPPSAVANKIANISPVSSAFTRSISQPSKSVRPLATINKTTRTREESKTYRSQTQPRKSRFQG